LHGNRKVSAIAEQAVGADRQAASRRRRERSISLCARAALSHGGTRPLNSTFGDTSGPRSADQGEATHLEALVVEMSTAQSDKPKRTLWWYFRFAFALYAIAFGSWFLLIVVSLPFAGFALWDMHFERPVIFGLWVLIVGASCARLVWRKLA
jgi:hypothetical protein